MNRLISQMQREIESGGPMTFARYMELALYAPGEGYYERPRAIGRQGDFYTSASVGPLFGELLAFQFAQWLTDGDDSQPLQIIEIGAHQGALAADILGWLQRKRPRLFGRLEYGLIEPSPARRHWQEQTLQPWLTSIKWFADVSELAPSPAKRILFSNEFLDALPVHRLYWNAAEKRWMENLVTCKNGKFAWQNAPPPAALAQHLPEITPELAAVLPDGYVIECSPAATAWWKKAAAATGRGKLLTLDYGFTAGEWLRPERAGGTLRTYARHRAGSGLLDSPGECDITAHVNFSTLEMAGCVAGLSTEGLIDQGRFLTQILAQVESMPGSLDDWTAARTKQFQTLTHPDHLGRAFRVLIQSTQ